MIPRVRMSHYCARAGSRSTQQAGPRHLARPGFTMIEILVVIAILAVLFAILLVAIQKVREAASRARCQANLHNIALAMHNHHDMEGSFVGGGWGRKWIGAPQKGKGHGSKPHDEPGGWIFQLLPYVEEQGLHDMGDGLKGARLHAALAQRAGTPVTIFNCPSRRTGGPYPCPGGKGSDFRETGPVKIYLHARADYAANAGSVEQLDLGDGPPDLAQGDDPNYPWPDTSSLSGVCFLRSEIAFPAITRGLSHTYLVGEKYVEPASYYMGGPGDCDNMFVGYSENNFRSTSQPPMRDQNGAGSLAIFGSAHGSGCNFAYCDGSVRVVSYTVDPTMHMEAGNRNALSLAFVFGKQNLD